MCNDLALHCARPLVPPAFKSINVECVICCLNRGDMHVSAESSIQYGKNFILKRDYYYVLYPRMLGFHGIEPRTVATIAYAVRRSSYFWIDHPQ